MNPGNTEPRPDQSPQPGHGANKRRRGKERRDGPRYPQKKVAVPAFECPFCKLDPLRYVECRRCRLTRLWDVIQHIQRQHLILQVTLGPDKNQTLREEEITFYCANCRCLFYGKDAEDKLELHMNQEIPCQKANIEQSGVILLREFAALKSVVQLCPRECEIERYFIIWDYCFPERPHPPSPYIEIIRPLPQVLSIRQEEPQSVQVLPQGETNSVVRRPVDVIHRTSSAPTQTRSRPPVPRQVRPNIVQRVPRPNQDSTTYMPSNPAFPSQALQPQMQIFGRNPDLLAAGYLATPSVSQRHNSSLLNDTLPTNSAPSPTSGFVPYTTYENNTVDYGYSAAPSAEYPTSSFQWEDQGQDYSNAYGNDAGPSSSKY
ncbi:hypothetical protein FGADI_10312 [Fusarium gaditjirri]|uniref:Uncharacterized protein n=1 Tax=Fusarium gaditjirri TaxID=282569 RepID=A0A8H4WRQ6_9HYPO|nr:hypothetical protein FGADI_10312 [Fusarium gaditjirri]